MTEALPYRGSSHGIPLFVAVEPGRPKLLAIGLAGAFTLLFGILLAMAMDYEMRHPMVMPWARGKIEEKQTPGQLRPEVIFSCELVHGSSVRVSAQVKAIAGLPAPTGQMRFLIGYETLKIVKMENGAATVTVRVPKSELHQSFRALYLGDDYYGMNYSNVESVIR